MSHGKLNVVDYQEKVKSALFVVELSNMKDHFISYMYDHERKGITYQWCSYHNWADVRPVADKWKSIYDVKMHPTSHRAVHDVIINCLPERVIKLHLKKSMSVVPKVILNETKECTLHKVYVVITESAIPTVSEVWFVGTHKGQVIEEQLQITDKMLSRFSPQNFLSIGF